MSESSGSGKGSPTQGSRQGSDASQNPASKPMPAIPSPITEEPNPMDQVLFGQESQAPAAPEQAARKASSAGVTWNMNPFNSPSDSSQSSQYSQSEWEKGLRNPIADRGDRISTAYPGRSVSGMPGGLRGASMFVAKAAKDVGSMDRQIGNPWDLKPGQTKRLASVAYDRPTRFEGRQPSVASSHARRPSTMLRDDDLIKLRGDDDPSDFVIMLVAEHDDLEHISKTKKRIYMTTPIWGTLTMVMYWIYFALRIRFTISAQEASGKIFGEAWAFIGVELGVAIPMMLHRVWYTFILGGRHRPKLRLIGNSVPSVDVLITCCGEDDELVYNTAKAACNIDYPTDRFRVIILDDGNSPGLRALVDDHSIDDGFDNMYYMSRPKFPGVSHHFKAGNLNYGLEATKGMVGGAANFIAALDADMIPERDWLRALLPHIIQDQKCSMSCPPQLFYNVPEDDLLCQSLDTFVHISEPVKDSLGVAWCTGSGYIMRRTSLDDIGWFPTGSLAEDVCTSSMMLGSGWNTAYVHEPLQFGTVPDSLSSHLKQRTRWTIGTIQTSLKLRFCLYGPFVKHMTPSQRFSGFVYTISACFTLFLVASTLTIPIVLISGGNLVPYSTVSQLKWLMRVNFGVMVANRICELTFFLPSGYRVGQREALAMMWMAPYHAIAVVQSFLLPKWLGGKIAVFSSSGSQSSELNERDIHLRAPLIRRLRVTLWNCKAWIHLLYIAFVLASIGLSTFHCIHDPRYNVVIEAKLQCLVTHAGWPPVLWLVSVTSFFVPIQYALWPPAVPDREELWERDPKSGVGYPSQEAKSVGGSWWHWMREGQYTMLCLYTTLIFVWSFIISGQAYY